MRISEPFANERKSEIQKYNPKFFIVSEGSNSEPQYFEGLNNSVISENIKIINILRDYATLRNSHPSFIIKMVKEFLLNTTENHIGYVLMEAKKNVDKLKISHYNQVYENLFGKWKCK